MNLEGQRNQGQPLRERWDPPPPLPGRRRPPTRIPGSGASRPVTARPPPGHPRSPTRTPGTGASHLGTPPGPPLRGAVGHPHLQRHLAPSASPSLRPRHRHPPRRLAHTIIAYGVLLHVALQQNLLNAEC